MKNCDTPYPIGIPGQPWAHAERERWRQQQTHKRSYADEVLSQLDALPAGLEKVCYGALPWDVEHYPLYALRSRDWQPQRRSVLITGGVHGYETSGVQGALLFVREHLAEFLAQFNWLALYNWLIVPCVSPWGYETINRWNPQANDPNRAFKADSVVPEATLLMQYLRTLPSGFDLHLDLHETTDTDNSEFRPALAARDGLTLPYWHIPDGFYLVADSARPAVEFQAAIIEWVATVTHIAPGHIEDGIIGERELSPGVIAYDCQRLGLCAGLTQAALVTTTEVYPDSPRTSASECNRAQVAAILGALGYLAGQGLVS
jgi:hypothetical protein